MVYDPEKHHRRSTRLKDYDYAQPGAYFVTIVMHDRQNRFGEITGEEMRLNRCGMVVDQEWKRLSKRFHWVSVDTYIVMPNHLHGIVIIQDRAALAPAETRNQFGHAMPGTLATIIRSFKSSSTQRINGLTGSMHGDVWQRGYHDRVIRSNSELETTCTYILGNPTSWAEDEENQAQLSMRR